MITKIQLPKDVLKNVIEVLTNKPIDKTMGICWNTEVQCKKGFNYGALTSIEVNHCIRHLLIEICEEFNVFSGCIVYPIAHTTDSSFDDEASAEIAYRSFSKWDKTTEYGRRRCRVYNRLIKELKRAYLSKI